MSEGDIASEPLVEENEAKRLSPLSVLVSLASTLPGMFFGLIALIYSGRSNAQFGWVALGFVVVLGGIAGISFLGWLRTRYELTDNELRITRGIIARQSRAIPFERIQDVGIKRKLVHRVLGLAIISIETGGSDDEQNTLDAIAKPEAEALRDRIRQLKHAATEAPQPERTVARRVERGGETDVAMAAPAAVAVDEPESEERLIYAMGLRRIGIAGLFNFSLTFIAVLFGLAQNFDFLLPFNFWDWRVWLDMAGASENVRNWSMAARIFGAISAAVAMIAVGLFTGLLTTLLREYGFRLTRTSVGFRRKRGLLTETDMVMPAHRVQAALIETGPVRKRLGWWQLKFQSLAKDAKETNHAMAPLAHRDEVEKIIDEVDLRWEEGEKRRGRLAPWLLGIALLLVIPVVGLTLAAAEDGLYWAMPLPLVLLALLIPMGWARWRAHGYWRAGDLLYIRSGWWGQRLTIVPLVKLQSLDLKRGPIDRLYGTADLVFGIAGSSGMMPLMLRNFPETEAKALHESLIAPAADVDFSDVWSRSTGLTGS